ncbi:PMD domain-containing protein [Cephalotus follicularis]|uniref:PMD domain-containing protein n=1 Tax=Cephalotus follicularis TaxID=3775 RepID=A0A1Q3CDU5_CEPFO|nr:PMD domain-containing protein [Cephalotus follicularis]
MGLVTCYHSWDDLCVELLGLQPGRTTISGTALRLSWLHKDFAQLPPEAVYHPIVLQRYARTYILCLLGMFLLMLRDLHNVDTYSWGTGILAWLYRLLCRACHSGVSQIGSNLLLLRVNKLTRNYSN